MKTTDELNTLRIEVAEKMGWTDINFYEDNAGPGFWSGYPPPRIVGDENNEWTIAKAKDHKHLPNFPVDENAAKQVREKLRAEGWNCTTESYTDGTHYVSFWQDTVIKKDEEHSAHADTLPVAICLAFLKVKQSK